MKRRFQSRWAGILFLFLSCVLAGNALAGTLAAQNSEDKSAKPAAAQHEASAEPSAGDANAGVGEILAKTTEQSAHSAEKWGSKIGLSPDMSFLISLLLNFAGVAAVFYVLLKSKLPQAFRDRTAAIQKGIKDAESASAEAGRRLSDIESRLSKLDGEVNAIRSSAERDAAAEEERIRQAAEEDKQKVLAAVAIEVAALAGNARRELKGYAASLAVDLAAREINVDGPTDQALVRDFVARLGKDGR